MKYNFYTQWPWRETWPPQDNRTEPGTTLVDIDYSALELRMWAQYNLQSVSTPPPPQPNRAARRRARSSRK